MKLAYASLSCGCEHGTPRQRCCRFFKPVTLADCPGDKVRDEDLCLEMG